MTAELRSGHVGLNVTDVDRSISFYQDALGFDVISEGKEEERRFAFLGHAGRVLVTLWQQAEEAYAPTRAGLHHLAFEVDSVDQVKTAEAALAARGVRFAYEGVVPHGEGAASGGIYFHDPDGTRLEIYAPSGAENATAPSGSAPTCGFF